MRTAAVALALTAIAAVRFVGLGGGEFSQWDECLYAARARAVAEGSVLDQTSEAVGGLYSSSHPPLAIWAMALSRTVFPSPLGDRIPPAAAGVLLALLSYFWLRMLRPNSPRGMPLVAATVVGLSAPTFAYSRLAQLDVPVVALLSLSLFLFARAVQRDSRALSVASGLALGLCLMTKIGVGWFAAPVYLIAAFAAFAARSGEFGARRILSHAILAFATALVVALPWHVMMYVRHGHAFFDSYFLFHLRQRAFVGVEGNLPALGSFFFANQLVIVLPASVLVVSALVREFRECIRGKTEIGVAMLVAWFAVSFLVVSMMRTKLAPYLIIVAVPAGLLAVYELSRLIEKPPRAVVWSVLVSATVVGLGWSFYPEARVALRSGVLPNVLAFAFALAALLGVVVYFSLKRKLFSHAVVSAFLIAALVVPAVLSAAVESTTHKPRPGMPRVADLLEREPDASLLVVGNKRNPQVHYYLRTNEDEPSRRYAHFEPISGDYIFGSPGEYDWVLVERDDFPPTDEADLLCRFLPGHHRVLTTDGYYLLGPVG
jgi:4-amino-4-deoxy-L-arabinose transferase-like glycosyltransferase